MNDCRFGVSPVNYPDPDPDLFATNPTVPNMTGYDEVKIMMTSHPVPDEFTFSDIPRLVRMYILFLI